MSDKEKEIRSAIRNFLSENMSGINEMKDDASLITSRLMDSIIALKLVSHLEEKFGIEFEAHEVDQDNLDTIDTMVKFVQGKMK